MKLVKVNKDFYDMLRSSRLEHEIMFNEKGRPCVLLVDMFYKNKKRPFVIPLRSNISPCTPSNQYFSLPPSHNTKTYHHHGVHYIKLFPIKNQYIEKYRIKNDSFYATILRILDANESRIVSECQHYLQQCENGNQHFMTPDLDGIIKMLESDD